MPMSLVVAIALLAVAALVSFSCALSRSVDRETFLPWEWLLAILCAGALVAAGLAADDLTPDKPVPAERAGG